MASSMDWDEYLKWLLRTKHRIYGRNMWLLGRRTYSLAFTPELVLMEHTRKKEDILKAISNLCRFLDIKHDTYLHDEFLRWLRRKEVRWKSTKGAYANYSLAGIITLDQVLKNIGALPERYKVFSMFVLVSGLRTEESLFAFNHHRNLCNGEVIEMFWESRTKKANAVFCHPILHERSKQALSYNVLHRNLHSRILGCQIRYLRKLNFTLVATKVDPLLAEFMQGRRGNISQRHYYLPMMAEHQKKWVDLWTPHISKVL